MFEERRLVKMVSGFGDVTVFLVFALQRMTLNSLVQNSINSAKTQAAIQFLGCCICVYGAVFYITKDPIEVKHEGVILPLLTTCIRGKPPS